jgi:uncharacterized protein (TIGR00369 family)
LRGLGPGMQPARRPGPSNFDERSGSESSGQALLLRGSPFAAEAGLRLVFAEEGHAVVTLPVHRGVGGESGGAHPGAITSLVEAAAASATSEFAGRHDVTPSGISINFIRPGSERPLVAEARILGGDAALRSCEVEVCDWNGTLVAKGFVTYWADGRTRPAGKSEDANGPGD